jgi:hypothetical protein
VDIGGEAIRKKIFAQRAVPVGFSEGKKPGCVSHSIHAVDRSPARRITADPRGEDFPQLGFVRLLLGLKRFAQHSAEFIMRLIAGSAFCSEYNSQKQKCVVTARSQGADFLVGIFNGCIVFHLLFPALSRRGRRRA